MAEHEALVKIADADERKSETQERGDAVKAGQASHVEQKHFQYGDHENGQRSVTQHRLAPNDAKAQQRKRVGKPGQRVGIEFGIALRARVENCSMERVPHFERDIGKDEQESRDQGECRKLSVGILSLKERKSEREHGGYGVGQEQDVDQRIFSDELARQKGIRYKKPEQ